MSRWMMIALRWLPLASAITLLSFVIYAIVQQSLRQALNDPQIQLAEDTAALIARPVSLENVIQSETEQHVDMATSLAPWVELIDASGTPMISSASLDGHLPRIPLSALEAARASSGKDSAQPYENRITWQPRTGVRQAIVIVWSPSATQYVVAGRNMHEVEQRIDTLGRIVLIGWLLASVLSLAFTLQGSYFLGRMRTNHGRS